MRHNRRLLKVKGAARDSFLNDLVTIPVSLGGGLAYGALLTPQGKILTDLFLFSEGDALILDLPLTVFEDVKKRLTIYRMRSKVEFEDDAREVWQAVNNGVADPRSAHLGARVYGRMPPDVVAPEVYLKARITYLVPEFDVDFQGDEAYPIEWNFDAMGGISYRKGCFVGQEVAARMKHKTTIRKGLARVVAEGEIATGDEILNDQGKVAGRVLSHSDEYALAYLRFDWAEGDLLTKSATLTVEETITP